MNMTNKSWFCGSSPTLTLIYAYAYRVELSGGSYTLVQEGEGAAGSEVNYTCVHQDLDQSPEEPKAVANLEEGKHRSHITFMD
jgi:hypothetical protein